MSERPIITGHDVCKSTVTGCGFNKGLGQDTILITFNVLEDPVAHSYPFPTEVNPPADTTTSTVHVVDPIKETWVPGK